MPWTDEVVIAAAGSGKTRRLITEALADANARVLTTTYTRENLSEINARLWQTAKGKRNQVTALTWFEFLLREAIKPYQSYKTDILRIQAINFITEKPPYSNRSDFNRYYLDKGSNVFSDAVADLAYTLNNESGGKVIRRLERLYDLILIDEMQDLAGWDLEFVEVLLKSKIRIVMVGDPRQAVYSTNRSPKNSQYRGTKIVEWVANRMKKGQCSRTLLSVSHRCNQSICDFADGLYSGLDATTSGNTERIEANDVHLVHRDDVDAYRLRFKPQALRWSKATTKAGQDALNFGEVKGREFPRVLIYPTSTILNYIERGDALKDVSRAKFYVAITRAQHSVGIVTDKKTTNSSLSYWSSLEPIASDLAKSATRSCG